MLPIWVQDVANKEHAARPAGRALLRYRDFKALEDSENRPYLHIVDGAVSDNLGLRGMLEAFEQLEASPAFQREMRFSELRHIRNRGQAPRCWPIAERGRGIHAEDYIRCDRRQL